MCVQYGIPCHHKNCVIGLKKGIDGVWKSIGNKHYIHYTYTLLYTFGKGGCVYIYILVTYPPACIYGDPHVITLDGLRYTFNGKGEFTLIETVNEIFTLQGRMVEVETNPDLTFDSDSPATVFSAIAGKQIDSDRVQFTINDGNQIVSTVNEAAVDFEMLPEQSFMNVVVEDRGNGTYTAIFSSGAYIEVKSANGFISLLLVSLANNFMNMTRGLMGSFNGDTADDLAPNGIGVPISSNSSLEEIHNQFGITCNLLDIQKYFVLLFVKCNH